MVKHKYLCKPDRQDLRDKIFSPSLYKTIQHLPPFVDLRANMPPVYNQGELGSCTANAIAGLRHYYGVINKDPNCVELSRLFIYWHEREMEGTLEEDSGAFIRDGMKTLQQRGVCPETDFPYDIAKFRDQPTAKAETDAGNYKLTEYHRVPTLSFLKASIAENQPVAIGIMIYQSFESEEVARTGVIPLPKPDEECLGGHAVLAVGYDDARKCVIVRNSWGPEWGDKGYFYLPYDFWARNLVTDMWTGR